MSAKFLYFNMTKNANKLFVTIAVVILSVCSALAQNQHPALGGRDGKTYLINTPEDLAELASYVNEGNGDQTAGNYYKLMKNIDLKNANWDPIGNNTSPFKGNFDGNKKIVKNLTINRPTTNYIGLFGYIEGGRIEKLGIENCSIVGQNHVGGMAGYNDASEIINCYVTGKITGVDRIGGVAGTNQGLIQYCYATGTVKGCGNIGGIAGHSHNALRIQYCVAAQDSLISDGTKGNIYRIGYFNNPPNNARINYACEDMVLVQPNRSMNNNPNSSDGTSTSAVLLQNRYYFYEKSSKWGGNTWDFTNTWQINNNDYYDETNLSGDGWNGNGWIYYSTRLPVFKGQPLQTGAYDEGDKESLLKFLKQQSTLSFKYLGLENFDPKNPTDDAWVEKLRYVYWNLENPKRLIGIGCGDFTELDRWERQKNNIPVKRFGGWSTKGLQGNLDVTAWTKLKHLTIHTSSDRLQKKDSMKWNHIESLTLGTKESLKTLNCSTNDLIFLDVSGCTALTRFVCIQNHLSDINLNGLEFDDFSGGGQNIDLKLHSNGNNTYSSDPIVLNNPLFFETDGVRLTPITEAITYDNATGILTCTDSTIKNIGFITETNSTGKRIGGVINLSMNDF